jgi:hypothetical protein
LLAVLGLASERRDQSSLLAPTVIATVNDRSILRAEFEQALAMFAADARTAPSEADQARVLRRLIEEELLVQEAVARGLLGSDRSLRETLTAALLASVERDGPDARGEYLGSLRAAAEIVLPASELQ